MSELRRTPGHSFEGVRVLVTGAGGFIGSHLTERLVELGASVRALSWYNAKGSHGWLDHPDTAFEGPGSVEFELGDVRDSDQLAVMCREVDIVFHLAALISIPHSYEAPRSHVSTNIGGTLNVLEGARRQGVRRVVHTSTSEVYGTPDELPIQEGHPLKGQSPYSASKIGADKLCEAYAKAYDLDVVVLRPFNTYGPRQSRRAVIPTILSQLLAGVDELHLGNLHPRRDFTFVSDTVEGFIAIAIAELERGSVVHLGTGTSVSIAELVEACCRVTGRDVPVLQAHERRRPEASEVDVLLSDPNRARQTLGWAPQIDLDEGLRRYATWLAENRDSDAVLRYER